MYLSSPMRLSKILFALSVVILIVTACATKNPEYSALTPAQQATNTAIVPYVPDPRINAYSNTAILTAQGLAPVNPYAGITDWGLRLAFGLIGAIATGVATAKNKNKVIDTIAASVVKAGPSVTQTVLDHAATTDHFPAVASAINDNTGINQSLSGATKPAL